MSYLDEHYDEIFKKYTTEELLKDIDSYKNGKGHLNKVLNHFFKECIFNCIGSKYNYSPMYVLNDDEIMNNILNYIKTKPNFYYNSEISNVESYLRMGGNYARKVANFDPVNARNIYFRYNDINGKRLNILDTSMGFGSRMSAVLLSGHNYCGFDPNVELCNKLTEYKKFLYDNNVISKEQKCCLRCRGSEVYFGNMKNAFDVSFTSPPYFNLEKYGNDNSESTKNYNNYQLWIEHFVKPTIENTYKYLKIGGYAMINIKNLNSKGKEHLFDDWFNIFKSYDSFELIEVFEINHQHRKYYTNGDCGYSEKDYNGFKEPVMCFRKVK
jgi:hypothetical protein